MGEIWRNMTDEDKKPYTELAVKDKSRFEIQNKAYKEKLEKEKKEKEAKEKEKDEEEDDDDEEDDSEESEN